MEPEEILESIKETVIALNRLDSVEAQLFGAVERERVLQEQIDEARRWAKAWKAAAKQNRKDANVLLAALNMANEKLMHSMLENRELKRQLQAMEDTAWLKSE